MFVGVELVSIGRISPRSPESTSYFVRCDQDDPKQAEYDKRTVDGIIKLPQGPYGPIFWSKIKDFNQNNVIFELLQQK